jgi:flavin-dependent dehydrogenase
MTDADLADLSLAGRMDVWRAQLAKSTLTRSRIGTGGEPRSLHVRSARTQRLDAVAGEGWLAVGDAAMSFDPLSSEGISKGLQMGLAAAAAAAALCRGRADAAADYARDTEAAFAEYLSARRDFYAAERRWPDAPFWQRRLQQATG